jgi:4-hydroxy-3-polyprenylbenzoate decarboxylase
MRAYLEELRRSQDLMEVNDQVAVEYEIATMLARAPQTTFLFRDVRGREADVAGNLWPSKARLARALHVKETALVDTIGAALRAPRGVRPKTFASDHWDVNVEADLQRLPILRHFRGEAGYYLSAGVVAVRYPGKRVENLSVHRMLVLNRKEVAARVVPRHLLHLAQAQGGEVDVAVSVGVDPAVFTATALQPAYGVGEYEVANALLGGRLALMEAETVEAAVPANAEIVLEGRLSVKKQVAEGPFVDLTGTYDEVRKQPTIRFTRLHMRRRPIYHAIVGGSAEHTLFMSLPQELKVLDYLRRVLPGVRGVNLTPAGCGYFHCIVSIDKVADGDGRTAILNCLAASHPLKLVIAVDSDIDPYDLAAVEWALATRFQADRGLVVVSGARGSTLDPSSEKKGVTAKLGLDATLPVGKDRAAYRRAELVFSPRVDRLLAKLAPKP